jgi:poly-gamma-glutamate synthesis protein (capsule biosynthesis protein)
LKEKPSNFSIYLLILVTITVVASVLIYASTFSSETHFNSPPSLLKSNPQISILVVGDVMLDRNVRNKINELGFDKYFDGVRHLVSNVDIAVANLEGPFTTFPSVTADLKSKELRFTFDHNLAPMISNLGFDILGLANNHTMNFGKEGYNMTKGYIKNAGMFYYGDPNNEEELSIVIERKGIKIGFVGFHEFTYINFDKVFTEIERLHKEVDLLIVTPHWGIEYQKEPTEKMRKWAHEFIDSGADVVIGAHPHIIGDTEEYDGKKIFYSLGNFAFDQYFSKETSEGLVVKIDLEKVSDNIRTYYTLMRVAIDRQGVNVSN